MRRLLSVVLLTLLLNSAHSQTTWPNTLLWRISGNGLSKPSYLFGTMHLQDKRLFNFTDSLYKALEAVDGFAMEIDFQEYMDSMFMNSIEKAQDELLAQQKVKLDRKRFGKTADTLLNKLGLDPENLNKKDLKKIRQYRMGKYLNQGEMPTIVDGYLYGISKRLGKWLGGVEDVSDQLDLSDELGNDLKTEEVFADDRLIRNSFEWMIKTYISQDLNGLIMMNEQSNPGYRDKVLLRRNIKMARRMDSLSALRSMFFAVGAAHLPGDSGVIDVLRSRGFVVEPVLSAVTIPAEKYAKNLNAVSWLKVEDDKKYFQIEMPGKPSDLSVMSEFFKMKMYFDITSMTFYMAGQTMGNLKTQKDYQRVFENMGEKMAGRKAAVKMVPIQRKDIIGYEGSFQKDEMAFKVQLVQKENSLFLIMAGASKAASINSPDIARFFASFHPLDHQEENRDWKEFLVKEKGVSVSLPGVPKPNLLVDKQAQGSGWNFRTFDFVDNSKALYYLFQVRDIGAGYILDGDSSYFEYYKQETGARMEKVLDSRNATYKGFPAFYADFLYKGDVTYKTFHVIRGNRIYSLLAGGDSKADFSDVRSYFNSLNLLEYETPAWKTRESPGFKVPAPVDFVLVPEKENLQRTQFVSYDTSDAVSYQVLKDVMSPYFWAANDSVYLMSLVAAYKHEEDSVISQNFSSNGGSRSLEVIIQKPDFNNLKKIRFLVNGDTLYTLMAHLPAQYIDKPHHRQFFDGFRLQNVVPSTLYNKKTALLLNALKSSDSAVCSLAYDAFNKVTFSKDDLPLLQEAFLYNYSDTDFNYGIEQRLQEKIKELYDTSTYTFITRQYVKLAPESDKKSYMLLSLLASDKRSESYQQLAELLKKRLPATGNIWRLYTAMRDSLELTSVIYPELLPLSGDTLLGDLLSGLTIELLEHNLIRPDIVTPYLKNFISLAKKDLDVLKQGSDDRNRIASWPRFFGYFQQKEGWHLLQEFSKLPDNYSKQESLLSLLKNDQAVAPSEVLKVAKDIAFRADFYAELQKIGKTSVFPAAYATQKKLAESELYSIAYDDYEPVVSFLKEATIIVKGARKKFLLFKITLGEGEEQSGYLGVAGPYELTARQLSGTSKSSGIYWTEPFDKNKVDAQLKAYLAELEE